MFISKRAGLSLVGAGVLLVLALALGNPGAQVGAPLTHSTQVGLELNTNRPGQDIANFWLSGGAEECQAACARDPNCRSFTYVKPGIQGPQARCWLKSGIPAPLQDQCCVSGLRPSAEAAQQGKREPEGSAIQKGIGDLIGGLLESLRSPPKPAPTPQTPVGVASEQPPFAAIACPDPNFDFEDGLICWTIEGTLREGGTEYNAFLNNPVPALAGRLPNPNASGLAYVHSGATGVISANFVIDTGKLVSVPFRLSRRYLSFLMGGNRSAELRVELLVRDNAGDVVEPDGRYRIVATMTNPVENPTGMHELFFNVGDYLGRDARIRVVDNSREGFITVDRFALVDTLAENWDFERGLDSWSIAYGDAFNNQPTWGDNVTVSRALPPGFNHSQVQALGGDYWNSLYNIGQHSNRWIGTYEDHPEQEARERGRTQGDRKTGAIVSQEFTIERAYITLLVGGGRDLNLAVEPNEVVAVRSVARFAGEAGGPPAIVSPDITLAAVLQTRDGERWVDRRYATGKNSEIFDRWAWDVRDLTGRRARIVIVDHRADSWGHINVDDIVFTDQPNVQPFQYASRRFMRDPQRDDRPEVWGFIDAHTHPMNYLAFGGDGRIFWGRPDGPIEQALRACDGYHSNAITEVTIGGRSLPLAVSRKMVQTLEQIDDNPDLIMGTAITSVLDLLGMNNTFALVGLLRSLPIVNFVAPPVLTEIAVGPILLNFNNKRNDFNRGIPHIGRGAPEFPRRAWVIEDRLPGYSSRPVPPGSRPEPEVRRYPAGLGVTGGWPNHTTRLHQQMHIDWIRRAHQGGMRLMVAQAGNTELFGLVGGNQQDIRVLLQQQLEWMRRFVWDNRDILEIAESAGEARRIVSNGKMAVVLGIEMVTIDRLLDRSRPDPYADLAERLRQMGLRHIYPIHNTDNSFGGTAIYNGLFNLNNYYLNGSLWQVRDGTRHGIDPGMQFLPANVHTKLRAEILGAEYDFWPALMRAVTGFGEAHIGGWTLNLGNLIRDVDAASREYAKARGHVNARGLENAGERFIVEMMRRGLIVDIDHSSILARQRIVDLAGRFCDDRGCYPLTSSHTNFQEMHQKPNETMTLPDEVDRLRELGGMVNPVSSLDPDMKLGPDVRRGGARRCAESSTAWLEAYQYAVRKMGGRGVGFGSDFNGFLPTPRPRFGGEGCLPATNYQPTTFDGDPGSGVRYSHYTGGMTPDSSRLFQRTPDGSQHYAMGFGMTDQMSIRQNQPPLEASRSGGRVFDVNIDGAAHIGMLPDFFQDVYNQSGDIGLFKPLLGSAESYIRMWENAERLSRTGQLR